MRLLHDVFGLKRLRPGQLDVIGNAMEGRDTLAIMPTGAGKSLCYQLPALMLPGRTVVVSPLIALMKDQCDKLRAAGVEAVQFNSALTADELADANDAVASGRAKIVFSTPERLVDGDFRRLLSALADEPARRSTRRIASRNGATTSGRASSRSARRSRVLGRPTLLALTATASEAVADDIERAARRRRSSRASAPASIARTCTTRSSTSRTTTRSSSRLLGDRRGRDAVR